MEVLRNARQGSWSMGSPKKNVDYKETFSPIARYTSIRAIMELVAKLGWKLHQMDVKTNFLNGVVEEEVYVEQSL